MSLERENSLLSANFILSSNYFGDAYRCDRALKIFSDRERIARCLTIEAALAKCQGDRGIIPRDAARSIADNAKIEKINIETLCKCRQETDHSIIPIIKALGEVCGSDCAQFIHFGATTQDIEDTEQSLALKEAFNLLDDGLKGLKTKLIELMQDCQDDICVGRTHYQPALPITFAYKIGSWIDELNRNRQRLEETQKRAIVLQMYGAVGSAASFGIDIGDLESELSRELKLNIAFFPWHAARDRIFECLSIFSMICSALARVANEMIHLSRPEVGEIKFQWQAGVRNSSTMPHKRNPEECEQIVTLSRLVYGQLSAYLSAPESAHERDFRNVRMEWVILPESVNYTAKAISLLSSALEIMVINRKAIKENLEKFSLQLCSEKLMFKLGEKIGKARAYEILSTLFEFAAKEGEDPIVLLKANPEIKKYFSDREFNALLNPREENPQIKTLIQRMSQ